MSKRWKRETGVVNATFKPCLGLERPARYPQRPLRLHAPAAVGSRSHLISLRRGSVCRVAHLEESHQRVSLETELYPAFDESFEGRSFAPRRLPTECSTEEGPSPVLRHPRCRADFPRKTGRSNDQNTAVNRAQGRNHPGLLRDEGEHDYPTASRTCWIFKHKHRLHDPPQTTP